MRCNLLGFGNDGEPGEPEASQPLAINPHLLLIEIALVRRELANFSGFSINEIIQVGGLYKGKKLSGIDKNRSDHIFFPLTLWHETSTTDLPPGLNAGFRPGSQGPFVAAKGPKTSDTLFSLNR
jgi:hypothetical protein